MAQSSGSKDTASSAENYEALQQDLARLRENFDKLVKSMTAEQTERTKEFRKSMEEKLREAQGKARETVDHAAAMGREGVASLERSVAERPLISLLTAFAVGIAIGHFLRRR